MAALAAARHEQEVADHPDTPRSVFGDPYRFAADEVAVELAVSSRAGSGRVQFALALHDHPATAQALSAGRLDRGKADVILAGLARLESATFAHVLEEAALDYATTHTHAQLKAWLNTRIIHAEPLLAEQRRQVAKAGRRVRLFAGDDGMATLQADLPAEDAARIYRTIDQIASASCANPTPTQTTNAANAANEFPEQADATITADGRTVDGRTMDQRRADAFTDLILAPGHATPDQAAASVHVVVDAATLAGVADHPAELAGYGPITAPHARDLIDHDSRWRRLLTDPTGHLLELTPTTTAPAPNSPATSTPAT